MSLKKLKHHRLIAALLRQPVDRTPIWMMRQAGRYLPEYRQLRGEVASFMELCQSPDLAAEVTLQPLRRFPLDAAIIFSDILVVADAMGMSLTYQTGIGPVCDPPIRTDKDVASLITTDIENALQYVMEAIRRVVKALDGRAPVIGFAGSPWTVACYMVEGRASKTFSIARQMLYRAPKRFMSLIEKLTLVTIDYLNAQIRAGARVIMLFDTWGGLLTTQAYQTVALQPMKQIMHALTREIDGQKIPIIFFTKQGGQWLHTIAESGCDAVGLDWTVDISTAREQIGHLVALQGNLDPAVLLSDPQTIDQAVKDILTAYGPHNGHIFNLGHGIDKMTPISHVEALMQAVGHYGQHFEKTEA